MNLDQCNVANFTNNGILGATEVNGNIIDRTRYIISGYLITWRIVTHLYRDENYMLIQRTRYLSGDDMELGTRH